VELEGRQSGSARQRDVSALLLRYFREDLKGLRNEMHETEQRLASRISDCLEILADGPSRRGTNNVLFDRFMRIGSLLMSLGALTVTIWKSVT
jgi:hypothetical protein